jgi:hypothetical protein
MGIIYCYNDMQSWGSELACEINRLKASSQMMTHAVQVTDEKGTVAFLHVYDREEQYVSELSEEIAKKSNVLQIPDNRMIRLHNDLAQQYTELGQWMPSTYLLRNAEHAVSHLNDLPYPIISRSSKYAQRNTRVLRTVDQAVAEISQVFSEEGLEIYRGGRQKDYVLWQPAWETQGQIFHVFMLGRKYAVITVVPAGGDPAEPISAFTPCEVLNEVLDEILNVAYIFAEDNEFDWVSMEIAPARDRVQHVARPFVLSISASWPFEWFERGGLIFEGNNGTDWHSTGIPAVKIWNVVADWIIKGGHNAP